MIWLIRNLRRDYQAWDRPARVAILLGLVLFLCALVVVFTGPPQIRTQALVGAGALVVVIQIVILYGNRGMTSLFTRAQRTYLSGDFQNARMLLEDARERGRSDARMLTLLGNTYRQLGDLESSARVLSEALDKAPDHHFPLYGFGRTLLSQGAYQEAISVIRRAVDAGAPPVVLGDLGEAYFRLGDFAAARSALGAAEQPGAEMPPHRELMVRHMLYVMGAGEPPSADLIHTGLPYWQASAERFAHTPYGASVNQDVRALESSI
ncbi:MAG: tetratricopeptide repeat protein [Anaerolineae bacterium]|nr:tetratricopeptide repeat protein [Anaerolineae bacterium]NUQ02340.1 tetratricopeptide repeat protein [Anaerolineae bacterium]